MIQNFVNENYYHKSNDKRWTLNTQWTNLVNESDFVQNNSHVFLAHFGFSNFIDLSFFKV